MRRTLGQHFLTDLHIVSRIIEATDLDADDVVVEIGPGKGILTDTLADRAAHLIAIEYDSTLAERLRHRFQGQDHVQIILADARTVRYQDLLSTVSQQRVKVVANLPYYAAIPIVKTLFRTSYLFEHCTFMFQKEVAERLTASPRTKSYGSLSLLAQYHTRVQYRFSVPPKSFRPPPKVDSAVVTLDFSDHPQFAVNDQAYFFQLVRDAFQTRRKTLKNSLLKNGTGRLSGDVLHSAFEHLHFHDRIRAEELSLEDFINLSNFLQG